MLAMETHSPHEQPLLKRSTSVWRRFANRDRTAPPVPSSEPRVTHKLQRRATATSKSTSKPVSKHMPISKPVPISKPILDSTTIVTTHMQRIDLDVPAKRAETTLLSSRRALKSDINTSPFPSNSTRIQTVVWNVFLTPEQVFSLVMGFRPERMEDKWFIYSEGPDGSGKLKVHFHRSWTGLKIAELFILIDLKGLGAGKIVGIKWNGSDQTNGMDEDEVKYMITTTCAWVLGVNMETLSQY